MYMKLDYFYFYLFDLEMKTTEISKYILPLSDEIFCKEQETIYQVLEELYSQKLSCRFSLKKSLASSMWPTGRVS